MKTLKSIAATWFDRASLPVRAVFLLSALIVIAILVASAVLLHDLRLREITHVKSEVLSLNRVLSDQTTRTFDGVVLTMRGVRDRLSDEFGSHLALDSPTVRLLLQARVSGLPQVKSLFLVSAEGLGINSSRPDFIHGLSMLNREFYRYFLSNSHDEVFVGHPEKAKVDGKWAYYVAIRLLDDKGDFRGVLVAAMNIDFFESLYSSIGLDSVTQIRLLSKDGVLMAGTPHDEANLGQLLQTPLSDARFQEKVREGWVEVDETQQEQRWFSTYHRVAQYPLVIVSSANQDEAMLPWRQVAVPMAVGACALIALILATSFLLTKHIRRQEAIDAALKESDAQLRHTMQTVRDAILTINSDKEIVLFNGAAERMFGIKGEDAIGKNVRDVLSSRLQAQPCASLLRYFDEGCGSPVGLVLLGVLELQRDGVSFPVELSLSTTNFHGELLVTAVFRDLSERQRAEHELLETNKQLQELTVSLQNVREGERARIARELHDELGQSLTGIRMEMSWLGGRLLPEQQVLVGKIGTIKGLIDQTIAAVRRISSDLRPLVLDDLGFAAAAGWYVDQFAQRTGLPVDLSLPEFDPQRGGAAATALFRILQESLTNVARHAQASEVEISVQAAADIWVLTVRDNGRGFDVAAGQHPGLGLIGMRERVQMLGGTLTVTSAPGAGTLIEAVLPIEENQEGYDGKI